MPRLYHTKSKTGCKRCRARRVKCDEAWPTCGGCLRHQVDCTYDRLDSTGNAASPASTTSNSSSSKPKSRNPSLNEGRDRRYRELRLMHAFAVQTAPTMAGTHLPELIETWSIEVPKLALDYEPLLSAIMAFASHHLARIADTQEKADEYMNLRSLYLESTLYKHRIAVGGLTKHNADAVSFTTVILTFDSFANLRDRPLEPYEPPLQWLQLSRGIGGVCKLALNLIQDDPGAKIWPVVTSMMPFIRHSRTVKVDALAHLLHVHEGEMPEAIDMDAYEETTRLLCWMLEARESGEHIKMFCRRMMAFSVLLPDRITGLLERRDSRALVMLAHFFALSSYASEFWWVGDMPRREISAIRDFLEPKWHGMMVWPMKTAQENVPNTETISTGRVNEEGEVPGDTESRQCRIY
ncbi:C6 transcription factor [Thelonectria olida]|uniref:C6 transcription factor n=1 Tax=Thelonectria olida TaxID=1576542 RepID=A0A9P8VZS9_9HYPO|nr:C6 transcription factor [Thelonectria olida]